MEKLDSVTAHPIVSNGGLSCRLTSSNPKGIHTINLPKMVLALLENPPAQSISIHNTMLRPTMSLIVADSGATDHMIPHKSAFISYYPVLGRRVCMGNNFFALILGYGSAIISLNGKKILICRCLHVPDLHSPLHSL